MNAEQPVQSVDPVRPKVVKTTSRIEKTYTLTLEGCDVRPWPYTKRTYRPHTLVVVKRDGNVFSTTLSGPQIKKDGSEGSLWADERIWSHAERPVWLNSLIGGLA